LLNRDAIDIFFCRRRLPRRRQCHTAPKRRRECRGSQDVKPRKGTLSAASPGSKYHRALFFLMADAKGKSPFNLQLLFNAAFHPLAARRSTSTRSALPANVAAACLMWFTTGHERRHQDHGNSLKTNGAVAATRIVLAGYGGSMNCCPSCRSSNASRWEKARHCCTFHPWLAVTWA
jgi:hypothetical protein